MLALLPAKAICQVEETPTPTSDSLSTAAPVPLPALANTPLDSLGLDTIPPPFFGSTADYQSSPDYLTAPVDYSAEDSMWVDFET
ncbi:MAG: hypothetical protein AAGA31_16925, partial [Bacteroidota bacterium]